MLPENMLQELVVHSCAVAHHQKLRCRSLAKVPMTLLKAVKETTTSSIAAIRSLGTSHRTVRNLRARQYDREVQSALFGWGPGHAVPVPGT